MNIKPLIAVSLLLLLVQLIGCKQQKDYITAGKIASGLTNDVLIGQMLIIALPSGVVDDKTIAIIKKYKPGGVVLFGYNLTDGSCKTFCNDLQEIAMEHIGIPLFIAIDQEGGRVKRIKNGVTQFPGNFALGVINNPEKVYQMAQIVGMQLRITGINMNFAPVLDVNNNFNNPVINIRSFSCIPQVCANLGAAYIQGLQQSRCIAVAKHFPGHGDTYQDSHITLPVINKTHASLNKTEFVPFKKAISSGVECIMTAHIAFPQLGIVKPATMSEYFLNHLLRKKMKFDGLIITDDLEMKGISGYYSQGTAAVASVKAGADIVLISSYEDHVQDIINSLSNAMLKNEVSKDRIVSTIKKIIEVKMRYGIMTIKKNKIYGSNYNVGDSYLEMMQHADKLNTELSRESIVYHSTTDDFTTFIPAENRKATILTTDKEVEDIFKAINADVIHSIQLLKNKKILFIDSGCYTTKQLQSIIKTAKQKDCNTLLLATGNPYPYLKEFGEYPLLMSFSDTHESLHQMALCLSGEFTPKSSHPCLMIDK